MINRLIASFGNMKVGRKLAYGFGAVVLLTVLVSAASYVGGYYQATALETLQGERDQSAALHLIVEETNEAEVDEHLFELTWRTDGYDEAYNTYFVSAKAHTAADLEAVAKAKELAGDDTEEVDRLTIIETALQKYDVLLDKHAELVKNQGNLDTGLEGDLRAAAHNLEKAIGLDPDNQVASLASGSYDVSLLPIYLEMRRNEKDFQLRSDPKYAQTTHDFNTMLQDKINASETLSPSQQATMVGQAKDYIALFDQHATNLTDIATTIKDLDSAADGFDPTLEALLADQTQQEVLAVQDYQAIVSAETTAQIVFAVLAVLTATLLAIAIARAITSQVAEINQLFRAAAIGNFGARAKALSHDELGQTAEGVNAMLERLTDYMGLATKAAQQRFSDVVTTMADWVWETDTEGNYTYSSDQLFELTGLSHDEVIGRPALSIALPEDQARASEIVNTARAGRSAFSNLEVHVARRDGSPMILVMNGIPTIDDAGNYRGMRGTGSDITERKQAEEQIEERNVALAATVGELRGLIANVESAAGQVTGASSSLQDVIQAIANDASSSASVAGQAAGSAQAGERAVTDTVSAMGRIRETTQETARRIKKLGEVSQEIGEVVRLIDEIADRVTVLALNASIQAAAAGEAGRGFAVVAEEVQRLAERATGATRQIENLIKGVQGEINEAMVSVEEVTQEVVGGSQLAQNAGDRMAELNQTVNELASLIQNIAQTTTRQTSDSLVTLTSLAENLQSSVAALRTDEVATGNGHGNGQPTMA